MEGNRGEVDQRRRWMDGVKGCLSDRGLTIPGAKEYVEDRREWRRTVGGGEINDPRRVKQVVFDLLRSGI